MKALCALVPTLFLVACAAPQPAVQQSEAPAVGAFRDICLSTAPSFSAAAEAAQAHGVTELTDVGFMRLGFNGDKSLGVQISENKECVVTTPVQPADYLTGQFLVAVATSTGTPQAAGVPSKVRIGGEMFILMHDRQGGEAFVMLKADNR